MLHKATQPDCPHCGCNQSEYLGRRESMGYVRDHYRCGACGRKHSKGLGKAEEVREAEAEAERGVAYYVMRCPQCNSKRVPTKSTQGRTRYHKCSDCDHRFKSIERESPALT